MRIFPTNRAEGWGSVALFAALFFCFGLSGAANATQRVLMITGQNWENSGDALASTLQGRGAVVSRITPTSTAIPSLMVDFAQTIRPGDDVTIVLRCHGRYENIEEEGFAANPNGHVCGLRYGEGVSSVNITARQIQILINRILHPLGGVLPPSPLPRINVITESCYGGALHAVMRPLGRQVCTMSFSGPWSPSLSERTRSFEERWSNHPNRSPAALNSPVPPMSVRNLGYSIVSRPIASSCADSIGPIRDSLMMGLHHETMVRVLGMPTGATPPFLALFGSCDSSMPSREFTQATQLIRNLGNIAGIDQMMRTWLQNNCHRFSVLGTLTEVDCRRMSDITALRNEVVRRIQEVGRADIALRNFPSNRSEPALDSLERDLELKLSELNPYLTMFEDAYCAAITPPDDPCVTHHLP